MNEIIKEKIQAPYKFTERETCELARKLAQANQRMTELEDQKKSVTSDFKARIDREQAEASLLAQHISQGYEMRETDVNVTLFPKEGTKHYHNAKTGEFIREERMTQADYQIEMRFEQARAEEARKKAAEQPPAAAVVEPTPEPQQPTTPPSAETPAPKRRGRPKKTEVTSEVVTNELDDTSQFKFKGHGAEVIVTVRPQGNAWQSRFEATVKGNAGYGESFSDVGFATQLDALNDACERALKWLKSSGTEGAVNAFADIIAKFETDLIAAAQAPA